MSLFGGLIRAIDRHTGAIEANTVQLKRIADGSEEIPDSIGVNIRSATEQLAQSKEGLSSAVESNQP